MTLARLLYRDAFELNIHRQTKPGWPLYRWCSCTVDDATAPKQLPARAFLSIFSVRSFTHVEVERKAYLAYSIRHFNPIPLTS